MTRTAWAALATVAAFAIAPTAPCTDVWVVWTPSDTGVLAPAITGDGPTSGPNAAHIAASRTAVPAMAAALTAVLALHEWYCIGCDMSEPEQCGPTCKHCYEAWPCPTVAAVETALEATT